MEDNEQNKESIREKLRLIDKIDSDDYREFSEQFTQIFGDPSNATQPIIDKIASILQEDEFHQLEKRMIKITGVDK